VSCVRENRMHGSTGGSWKRSTPATDTEKNAMLGNHLAQRLRDLPPGTATAPAPDPTPGLTSAGSADSLGMRRCTLASQNQVGGWRPADFDPRQA
jgi:hypothetical protein